jgi:outer membrane lipoprotein-sorting protein
MSYLMLALVIPVLPAQDGGNEAEKLFRALGEKIARAKSLRVAYAAKVTAGDKVTGDFKGLVELKEGNQIRVEMAGQSAGKEAKVGFTADGKKLKARDPASGKEREAPLPGDLSDKLRMLLSRVGATMGTSLALLRKKGGEYIKGADLDKLLRLSDFRSGKDVRIDGRPARVLEYKVTLEKKEQVLSVRLWLDARSLLPLKREVQMETGAGPGRAVETYSEFKLGPEAKASGGA